MPSNSICSRFAMTLSIAAFLALYSAKHVDRTEVAIIAAGPPCCVLSPQRGPAWDLRHEREGPALIPMHDCHPASPSPGSHHRFRTVTQRGGPRRGCRLTRMM
ncbi:hypothetical protein B0H15DRAFT_594169 [Mycena belliarum]|uniref:Secreted protein n=1 Tax=Mycena belliarum TaxID=1033014 RepID=A0AAD6TR44_9AGAR|nr:hypothetical protein B0H15DRAFT_594169 [Mycena belliae]